MLDQAALQDPTRALHARLLELRDRRARADLLTFAEAVLRPDGKQPAAHHRKIIQELQALIDGNGYDWLVILAPPGSGKSFYVTRVFVAWYLANHPGTVIGASHTVELAELHSKHIHRIVQDFPMLNYTLLNENKGDWETSHGAEYKAVGAGGNIRGRRANLAVLDDVVKSVQEADSPTSRATLSAWFDRDVRSRITPGGKLVVVGTCFHEADLLAEIQQERTYRVRVLKLRAIAEADDELHRPIGEPLWNDDPKYGFGALCLKEQARSIEQGTDRAFSAEWQCEPTAARGNYFRPEQCPVYDQLPPGVVPLDTVRAWDLASSAKASGDFTCRLKLVCWIDGVEQILRFAIVDVVRFRGAPEEVRATVLRTAEMDGHSTYISLPVDPAQAGRDQFESYTRLLSGFPIVEDKPSGDKRTRATAVAAQLNSGRVGMLRAGWNAALAEELRSFDAGRNDDQVDSLSSAYKHLEQKAKLLAWYRL